MPKSRYGLTPREFEIIDRLCTGESNQDIATVLGISVETVKRHISNIFDKTGQSTRTEVVLFAISRGLSVISADPSVLAAMAVLNKKIEQIEGESSDLRQMVRDALIQTQRRTMDIL